MSARRRPWAAGEWNGLYPPGTPVRYVTVRGHADTARTSRTRSAAWTLGDGTAVVKIEGLTGGVALSHLTPYTDDSTQHPKHRRHTT